MSDPRWFTVPECESFGHPEVKIRLDLVVLFGAVRFGSGSWDVWLQIAGSRVGLGMTDETLERLKVALGVA